MSYKKGDTIISLRDDELYTIKYLMYNFVIVSSGKGYDMPLRYNEFVPYSTLMEELI
jgi:hypothetical protein